MLLKSKIVPKPLEFTKKLKTTARFNTITRIPVNNIAPKINGAKLVITNNIVNNIVPNNIETNYMISKNDEIPVVPKIDEIPIVPKKYEVVKDKKIFLRRPMIGGYKYLEKQNGAKTFKGVLRVGLYDDLDMKEINRNGTIAVASCVNIDSINPKTGQVIINKEGEIVRRPIYTYSYYSDVHYWTELMVGNIKETNRRFFEVIPIDKGQKMRFDIDMKEKECKTMTIDYSQEIISNVLSILRDIMNLNPCKDIFVCSSHLIKEDGTYAKISYHIIINNHYFKDCYEVKGLYKFTMEKVNPEYKKFIDFSVYDENQLFRMLFNSKPDEERFLVYEKSFLLDGITVTHEFDTTSDNIDELLFKESLITYIEDGIKPFDTTPFEKYVTDARNKSKRNKLAKSILPQNKSDKTTRTSECGERSLEETKLIENFLEKFQPECFCFAEDGDEGNNCIKLTRLNSSWCFVHERDHDNQNPFLNISLKGDIYFNCGRGKGSRIIGNIKPIPLPRLKLKPKLVIVDKDNSNLTLTLTPNESINSNLNESNKNIKYFYLMSKEAKEELDSMSFDDVRDNYLFSPNATFEHYSRAFVVSQFDVAKIFHSLCKDDIKSSNREGTHFYNWNEDECLWLECDREGLGTKFSQVMCNFYHKLVNENKLFVDDLEDEELKKYKKFISDEFMRDGKAILGKCGDVPYRRNVITAASGLFYDFNFLQKIGGGLDQFPIKGGLVVNLRTKEVRKRIKEDYLTMEANVSYSENRDYTKVIELMAPLHLKYPSGIENKNYCSGVKYLPDEEMLETMQRLFGYFLTREVCLRKILVFHGEGKNGKSIMLDLLSAIMGPFFLTGSNDVLFKRRQASVGAANHGLVEFVLRRAGLFNEPDVHDEANGSFIKLATGVSEMNARGNYEKNSIKFKFEAKIIVATNQPLNVHFDSAIIARWCSVFWGTLFSNDPKDRLKSNCYLQNDKLIRYFQSEEGKSLLFNFFLDGSANFYEDYDAGLEFHFPKTITDNTKSYVSNGNSEVEDYIRSRYIFDKDSKITLISIWKEFLQDNKSTKLQKDNTFKENLKKLPDVSCDRNNHNQWVVKGLKKKIIICDDRGNEIEVETNFDTKIEKLIPDSESELEYQKKFLNPRTSWMITKINELFSVPIVSSK